MSYAINNLPSCITIGRETETAVTEIRIDCTEWLDRWPDMDVSVIVRTGRGAIYIPANLTMEGKTLVWCVDDVDTSILNKSTMEITGIAPDRHKLSEKVDILVDERLAGTTGETPDPMKPWVDRVIEAANTVGDARDDAVSAKDEAFDSANVAYKAAFDARESEKNAHASEQEAAQSANIAKDAEENTRATLVTVNGLAEYAKSSAEMAKESEEKSLQNANNAGTYATSAKESEIIARESGETAKTSAQSAQTSAGSAAESANQAKRSEEAAKGYADNTGEYARIATEKAQKATEQANSAGVSATSAEESANRASASEQNAATSAQEAKSSADSAKGYSESANEASVNASDSAREAQSRAENAATSANNAEASKVSAQASAENARVSSQNAVDALQEIRDKIASGEFKGEPGAPGKDAVVDATLTQSGQAADAKATGDVVSQLKGDLDGLNDTLFNQISVSGNPILIGNAIRQMVTAETESSKIYAFGKNIVDINRENVVTSAPSSNSTVRDFSKPAIWVGLSVSNYFNNAQVAAYSINGDTISVTNKNLLGYGIAFNLPTVSGQKIAVSFVEVTNAVIRIGYYNNGSYVSSIIYNSANIGRFTVPDNVNQMIVCVDPSNTNSTGVVKGLQIEYSELQTEYEAPLKMIEYNVVDGRASIQLMAGANTIIADSNISFTYKIGKVKDTISESEVNELIGSKLVDYVRKDDPIDSWYRGKKIATFGDSITNMNMWQPFMAEFLGCTYTRHGIGGGTVAKTNNQEHLDDCMYMDSRINALESDADVILVFGGHNDWGNRVPIGSIPTDNSLRLNDDGPVTEFVYAYSLMIKKLVLRFPNAKIFTMSCVGGRHDSRYPERDDGHYYIDGLSMEDYADAVKMVSAYYGIPCIDLSSLSGISTLNHGTYLGDEIHPNTEGGKLIAERVCRELLRFEPIVYTSTWDDIRLEYDVTNV